MTPPRLLTALLLAACAALPCSGAAAAPEDDYRKAARTYAQGDVVTAMAQLKPAADAGHAAAQALYAHILDRADSDEEAVAYYRKSAEQGNADGQFGYGAMLAAGKGIKKDVAGGRDWIQKAATQGHKLAINELALAYLKGGLGLADEARDDKTALRWVRQAADNDFLPAVDGLADAYRTGGLGLVADAKAAEEWAAKARKLRGITGKRKGDRK